MVDTYGPKVRSQVMKSVKSKGNLSTEWRIRSRIVKKGIRGWELHPRDIIGTPDFVFRKKRIAVFVDGCFWHGCRYCRSIPITNRDFWSRKINSNRVRDTYIRASLGKRGWTVIAFWEHEIKEDADACVMRIEPYIRGVRNRPK